MIKENQDYKRKEPTVAAGDDKFLKAKATKEEIRKGNFTRVTSLSFDEVDPS